ncbi:restriction endonuclease subunit S [Streptomyces sp. R28]|uniref:Restriction endonuclease subunit S n=1 Tax=Streptomyces sp. R28 TaxID=3238628 RepID=A0AB39PWB3_9ACTN
MSHKRIKFQCRVIDQRAGKDQPPLMAVSIHHGVVRRDSLTDDLPRAEDLSNYKLCETGDIVLNRMRAFQGAIGISSQRGIVSPDYLVLRPGPDVDAGYLHHLFRSAWFVGEMVSRLRGIGNTENGSVRTPRINSEDLLDIEVPFPSLNEQRRIADFLDVETTRIDQLISDQSRVISLLDERVSSQILGIIGGSRLAITGGTNISPIRRLLVKLNRATMATDEVITAFRDGQVTTRNARRNEGYTLATSTEPQGQGVKVGDIVIHGLDGFAGAIGDSEAVGNCSPVYHVCTPLDGGNPAFYGRLLRVLAVEGYLGLFASSTRERAVDFRSWDLFGNIPVPRVDIAVQHEIGESVVSIRPLRERVTRFNERLAERRQALITAAVTGQIDVTTARPQLPSAGGVSS